MCSNNTSQHSSVTRRFLTTVERKVIFQPPPWPYCVASSRFGRIVIYQSYWYVRNETWISPNDNSSCGVRTPCDVEEYFRVYYFEISIAWINRNENS